MKLKPEPMSKATAATQDQQSCDFCWEWRLCPESALVASHTDDSTIFQVLVSDQKDLCWHVHLCMGAAV